MRRTEGTFEGQGLRVTLVASRTNDLVTLRLVEGALDCLRRHGVADDAMELVRVPGSFELPPVCARVVAAGRTDAVIALGTVIRGETPHFDYVARSVSGGLAGLALEAPCPVIFGVVTADTLEQALERAGAKEGNRGWEAALSALEMARLYRALGTREKKK